MEPMLSELEKTLLRVLVSHNEPLTMDEVSRIAGIPLSSLNSVAELLKSKGLIVVEENREITYKLTEEGERVLREGFPEERLISILWEAGEMSLEELRKFIPPSIFGLALGAARKRGLVVVEKGVVKLVSRDTSDIVEEKKLLEKIKRGEIRGISEKAEELRRRGLVERKILINKRLKALERAKTVLQHQENLVSRLSSHHIVSGEWRRLVLKPYNVEARPPYYPSGLPHFYLELIRLIRGKLFEMGFIEEKGSPIETEFWNFDVLFQAQDHPAREVHDTFWIDVINETIDAEEELIKRTKKVHETGGESGSKGWGGSWKREIASRLVLRTQMTCVSARILSRKPLPPFRYFSIGPVYRPDIIDSRHLPNFYQLDGIVSDEDMNFSKLLGVLKEFFERLGLEELRFKPGYFPFTEPSVEGYARIPGQGWVELFGAGMFRPEVLEILGVDYDVGAWGIGLDRLAMSLLGIPDIRMLYSRRVSELKDLYPRFLKLLLKIERR